jgi:hypothetical protein
MSTTEKTPRIPGWHRVLDLFMADPQRTVTNVELGNLPGLQAWHQRVTDLKRRGYIITPSVLVGTGRYAYKLVGIRHDASTSLPYVGQLDGLGPSTPVQVQAAVNEIKANAGLLAKRGGPRTHAAASVTRQLAEARERVTELEMGLARIAAAVLPALGLDAKEDQPDAVDDVAALVERVATQAKSGRPPAAPRGTDLIRKVLTDAGQPMHVSALVPAVMAKTDAYDDSRNPTSTISGVLARIDRRGGEFERVGTGVFALRSWDAARKAQQPLRSDAR